jgi:hypothetical protein
MPLKFTHGDLSGLKLLFAVTLLLALLIGKRLVGIHHIGNTQLAAKSTHKFVLGQ